MTISMSANDVMEAIEIASIVGGIVALLVLIAREWIR